LAKSGHEKRILHEFILSIPNFNKESMKKEEYELSSNTLLLKWEETYKDEDREFSFDGISDFDIWNKEPIKILFLLKETNNDFQPKIPKQKITGLCGLNMARWNYAIKSLFENSNIIPTFPQDDDLPNYLSDLGIALVEIKKIAGGGRSNNRIIESYAIKDKNFLKEQIGLINPKVILCCGTNSSYEIIYDWKPIKIDNNYFQDEDGNDCSFWIHNQRLIIYFYHPTTIGKSPEIIYNLLCRMIKEGKAFERLNLINC